MPKRRLILFGAYGFVGRVLTRLAEQDGAWEVRAMGSDDLNLLNPSCVRQIGNEAGPEVTLLMLAAIGRDRSDSLESAQANLTMGVHLAKVIRDYGAARCLFVSSASVYGEACSQTITEETPLHPDSYYAVSKYATERLLQRVTAEKGVPLVIVRPCRIYGPNDERATYGPSRFIRSVIQERRVELYGDGAELRDHLFVEDAARLMLQMAGGGPEGVFNLASGQSESFRSMLDLLRQIYPTDFELVSRPRSRPAIDLRYDTRKLRGAVGEFRLISLKEGIEKTVDAEKSASLETQEPVSS